MKKLSVLLIIVLSTLGLYAQTALPKVTVSPSEIDALTENVSFTFDVTGSAVEGLTDVYIWSWAPGLSPSEILLDYEQGSASWGSISSNAKLDPVPGNPNLFSLALPKTVIRNGVEVTFNNIAELFGVADTPGKLKEIGYLLRSQDGSKQTPGDLATKITLLPLEFTAAYFRTFPSQVSNKDVVTAYLNLNQMETTEDQKLKIAAKITASITLLSANNIAILTVDNLETSYTPEKEYAVTFLPEMIGTLPEGVTLNDVVHCQVVFSGEVYEPSGLPTLIKTKTFDFSFQQYE